jgi:hypothetical protein
VKSGVISGMQIISCVIHCDPRLHCIALAIEFDLLLKLEISARTDLRNAEMDSFCTLAAFNSESGQAV